MKKVLVTGASGAIGKNVLKYLLSEGKYEITAVDLKTKKVHNVLKKYRKRVNVIYGDVCDHTLMEPLVKEMDYIIHLAGVMPPLADLKMKLSYEVDYKGTENIVRLISFYNPKCHLLYASSTSIYGKQKSNEVTVNTKSNLNDLDYFSKTKLEIEKLIKDKLNNYSIYRLPLVLTNPAEASFIYNFPRNQVLEVVSDIDAGYMFSKAIDKIDLLNKKTFNVGGGEYSRIEGKYLMSKILSVYGVSSKYFASSLFLEKNHYSFIYKDSDKLNDILNYRNDSVDSFFLRLKRKSKSRKMSRFFGKLFMKRYK